MLAILQCSKQAPSHIRIKADLSKEARVRQSVLLKERWSLMQSGVEKKDIKITESKLIVRGRLHGHADGPTFILASNCGSNAGSSVNSPPATPEK